MYTYKIKLTRPKNTNCSIYKKTTTHFSMCSLLTKYVQELEYKQELTRLNPKRKNKKRIVTGAETTTTEFKFRFVNKKKNP